jgi:GNAT superfamily N-acetyltransferase
MPTLAGMTGPQGYTIDRVVPSELPADEQVAIARLFQRMSKEILPEDPERPLEAILPRLRATVPNEWHARSRARDARGNVVAFGGTERSLNDPENAHVAWTELQVHPDHRRRGLARAIFADLVAQSEGQHPKLMFMGMTNDRVPSGAPFLSAIGAKPGLPGKLVQLLPPVHKLDGVASRLITNGSAPTSDVIWLLAYGALFFALGLILLRQASLAD